jgi:RNA polymerase sigma-54 factor
MAISTRLSQQQEPKPKLKITAKLTQSITLLQYTAAELLRYVEEIAQENPFLEVEVRNNPPWTGRKTGKTPRAFLSGKDNLADHRWTLYDELQSQVAVLSGKLSPIENQFLRFLIENLDERGYLPLDLSEAARALHLPEEAGIKALRILQSLEPAGIGARSLAECIELQLRRKGDINPKFFVVLEKFFHEFLQKKWKIIEKALNIPQRELQDLLEMIQRLNWRPGAGFSEEPTAYVWPDILVRKNGGRWEIRLLEDSLYRVHFNEHYYEELKDVRDQELHNYIREKYLQYVWLKNGIEHRKKMMVRMMKELIRRQERFLSGKNSPLAPMTMKEVAGIIGVHESTVSRMVKNKWILAPVGTIPLKDLFTPGLKWVKNDGKIANISSRSLQKEIARIVENEDKRNPYSDQEIAEQLRKRGFQTSRRTVSKYRMLLNIPPSPMRKWVECE